MASLPGRHRIERDAQRNAVVAKLDLVTDKRLDTFINAFWTSDDLSTTSPEMARQIASLCDRISRISDPDIAKMIHTHGRVHCR